MFNFFGKKDSQNASTKGESITFKIDGMHCVSCSLNIDGALEETDGVLSATTNFAKAETVIEFDAKKISQTKLKKIISDEGYTVV